MELLTKWIICGVCSYLIIRIWLEGIAKEKYESFAHAMRESSKNDGEDVSHFTDGEINAVTYTIILVLNLLFWPLFLIFRVIFFFTKLKIDNIVD